MVACLLACAFVPAVARSSGSPSPDARVGAFYFDGWAGDTSSFHFGGLLSTPFSVRRPLSGWRDNTPASLKAQLRWAHEDGIGFFAFDWYYNPDPGNGPINEAHDTYLKLKTTAGLASRSTT
jgi:hypothetical protein